MGQQLRTAAQRVVASNRFSNWAPSEPVERSGAAAWMIDVRVHAGLRCLTRVLQKPSRAAQRKAINCLPALSLTAIGVNLTLSCLACS